MTKSKASTANFLPIIAIAILIAAAGFLLTMDDLELPWMPSDKVTATHLVNFPREVPTLQELEKDRKVLKSQDELENYLNVGINIFFNSCRAGGINRLEIVLQFIL